MKIFFFVPVTRSLRLKDLYYRLKARGLLELADKRGDRALTLLTISQSGTWFSASSSNIYRYFSFSLKKQTPYVLSTKKDQFRFLIFIFSNNYTYSKTKAATTPTRQKKNPTKPHKTKHRPFLW